MRDYNGTNLFFPPFFFVHRSVDFSLLFLLLPLCVSISIFAIFLSTVKSMLLLRIDATRYRFAIWIPNAFSFFSLFLLFLSLYLFIVPKLDFRMRFRLADEKDRFGKSRERNAAWNRFEENEQLEEAISFFISSSFSFFLFSFLLDEKQKDLFYLDTRYIHIVHVRFEACLACLILPYLIRRNGLDNFT